jgi:MFS family permease
MRKLVFFLILLLAACAVAVVCGVVHHQIAFDVSPEVFTEELFEAQQLPEGKRGRTGAAVIGVRESWWLGLVVGPTVAGFGLIVPGRRTYLRHSLVALGIVGGVALLTGLSALLVASAWTSESSLQGVWFPQGVTDRVAYASAGAMRDFTFIGAWVGVFFAWAYLLVARRRVQKMRLRRTATRSHSA